MTVTYIKKGEVGGVFMDKISIVLDIPVKEQLEVENNLNKLIQYEGKQVYRTLYQFTACLYLEYPNVYVEVSIKPKLLGIAYMRVELNPAHGFLGDFNMLMDKILLGGYSQLIEEGRCTRIDAAVDIVGVNVNDLLITYPKIRKTKGFYNNGKLETYTLGIKNGLTEVCVYDKASQIKYLNDKFHLNLVVPHKDITRIEVRRKKKYQLKCLANLPNFFDGILIASHPPLVGSSPSQQQKEDKEKFGLFLEVCRSRGAQDALKMVEEKTRKRYQKLLGDCKLPWWNPADIWKKWDVPTNALLNPTHLGK